MFSLHYCWVSCLFLETKMLYNFDSQAANVSHCDSEPINVERIQTGCVRLFQPCPWSMSCDQSAAEHTSGSYQKNTQVHVGLLQLEVLFYNTDQLEWSILLPPLPQRICQADSKSCSYSTEQLKRIQHFTAIPLGITVSKPKLFLCGISSRI